MVQRLTYRKRHSYATKSNQTRVVKTPGNTVSMLDPCITISIDLRFVVFLLLILLFFRILDLFLAIRVGGCLDLGFWIDQWECGFFDGLIQVESWFIRIRRSVPAAPSVRLPEREFKGFVLFTLAKSFFLLTKSANLFVIMIVVVNGKKILI